MNVALVFVKPHAVNDKVLSLTRSHLEGKGIKILKQGELTADVIKAKGIIDDHYAALAANAVKLHPRELLVSADRQADFEKEFGKSWTQACSDGSVMNLAQYQEKNPSLDVTTIESRWRAGKTFKLAPGNYVSLISDDGAIVVNGFYGSMREKFTAPGAQVNWMQVEFDEASLSWKAFRNEVIGATDPNAAAGGSLRKRVMEDWQSLGLAFQPNTSDNSIHASAGPLEGLREREIWMQVSLEEDPFGKQLLSKGVKLETIRRLCGNEVVSLGGSSGPAFDVFEEMDSSKAIEHVLELQKSW
ncbi:hypothetical protein GUITHDRAFT_66768 [Guillardia theta CCMP2712]|uniref:Nucleoside diphosphate kinase-like domain-containing protein n=1 Tax=Guillardia theta (strain CCMP2712) TaxID=905079 RepID=L1JPP1_GUITC|nr:hypothetical protein GUITHDRAFT_66768 [Guillardia theta CCMP2712]EKX50412.1 hypothetical protein GUITHDRAFT_66768 [Guillardia theta CCMP2712]|eukprot:XP_005837392.1 hypothetical protein GUITHDRAFT_66768 [Guillardia theta CCMP2712]